MNRAASAIARPTPAWSAQPRRSEATASIVVVDDDPDLAEALSELLGEEGFEVEVFTEPMAAVERLRSGRQPPAAVLLDYLMPGMTGAQFVSALEGSPFEAPILLFTGLSSPSVELGGRVACVLRKPIDADHLLDELRRLGCTSRGSAE